MTDLDLCRLAADAYATPTAELDGDVGYLLRGNALAIRGTRPDRLADWWRDIDAEVVTDPILGGVHRGCLEASDAIFAHLMRSLRTTEFPTVICGHSLGGGIAAPLAASLVLAGFPVQRLVTFGAMRAFADGHGPAILSGVSGAHYWHAGDPVPDLPPGFAHWREPTSIGRADLWPISDHLLTAYLPALEQL